MPRITFVQRDGTRKDVSAPAKTTLLQAAHANDIDMEGACEGSMACSTCHVIVGAQWSERLPKPSEPESDMLDLTYGVTPTSRLACQIVLTESLDGLVVTLPVTTRNMME